MFHENPPGGSRVVLFRQPDGRSDIHDETVLAVLQMYLKFPHSVWETLYGSQNKQELFS